MTLSSKELHVAFSGLSVHAGEWLSEYLRSALGSKSSAPTSSYAFISKMYAATFAAAHRFSRLHMRTSRLRSRVTSCNLQSSFADSLLPYFPNRPIVLPT